MNAIPILEFPKEAQPNAIKDSSSVAFANLQTNKLR